MDEKSKLNEIWEVINTLTEEAQEAAFSKCKEIGFLTDQGIVPLNESFLNLNTSRAILRDAIEKNKLINLPITIQKTLYEHLSKISNFLTSLIGGTDQVINLVDEIEKLNFAI